MIMKKNKKHRFRLLFSISMFFLGIYISFDYLSKYEGVLSDKYSEMFMNLSIPNYSSKDNNTEVVEHIDDTYLPRVYIYNSHPTEEYASNLSFSFRPNVTMVNSILKSRFEKSGIDSYIEDRSVEDLLNHNNWNYASSYKASRIYLEEAKSKYSSLEYFIDVHRDSLRHDRTTVSFNNKNYATLLFLIGLENPNYLDNIEFTERIVSKINERYPGICKGIMQKGGPGNNGVYNQDFSKHLILLEVGGEENTIAEVLNSTLAFSECFLEVINEW